MLESSMRDGKHYMPDGWAEIADASYLKSVEVGIIYGLYLKIPASIAFCFLFNPRDLEKQTELIEMLSEMQEKANDRWQI